MLAPRRRRSPGRSPGHVRLPGSWRRLVAIVRGRVPVPGRACATVHNTRASETSALPAESATPLLTPPQPPRLTNPTDLCRDAAIPASPGGPVHSRAVTGHTRHAEISDEQRPSNGPGGGKLAVRGGQAAAVVVAGVTVAAAWSILSGSGTNVALAIGGCCVIALGVLIGADASRRGRSGPGWVLACAFLAPIAIPLFLLFAVTDRTHGRSGIEASWPRPARWCALASVVLAVAASLMALANMSVPGETVSTVNASGNFSGHCSNALSEALGDNPFGGDPTPATPAALATAQRDVQARCSAAAARRMAAAAITLGGSLALAMIGLAAAGRRRPSPYPPSASIS